MNPVLSRENDAIGCLSAHLSTGSLWAEQPVSHDIMKTIVNLAECRVTKQILVVDDHPLTRHGVCHLLNSESDLQVCGEADTAAQALAMLESLKPDLVVADISMPSKSGLEFVKDLKTLHPDIPVLILSMHDENIYAARALRAGARGYVMKSERSENLLTAIRQILLGQIYVSKELSLNLVHHFISRHNVCDEITLSELTDREFEVFQLIGQGLSTVEIGRRLCISAKTVETHRIHLKEKLKLRTAMDLTSQAVRWATLNQLA